MSQQNQRAAERNHVEELSRVITSTYGEQRLAHRARVLMDRLQTKTTNHLFDLRKQSRLSSGVPGLRILLLTLFYNKTTQQQRRLKQTHAAIHIIPAHLYAHVHTHTHTHTHTRT